MSFQVREKVTLLPAVPTAQNGSNTAHTLLTIYDDRGRVTRAKSPRGFINHFNHFQYDDVTGAVVRRIDDVDTSRMTGVPGGWSTPNSGAAPRCWPAGILPAGCRGHQTAANQTAPNAPRRDRSNPLGPPRTSRWHRISDPAAWVEKLIFGYDKADNRLWRVNALKTNTEDELYGYDGLHQVQGRKRGHLNAGHDAIASPARIEPNRLAGGETDRATARPRRSAAAERRLRHQHFTYDPLGNWNHYKLTASLDQDRTHNTANQISTIEGSPSLLAHYPTGNMTTVTPAHHEYWDAAWRLIEERSGTATTPDFQYLYGLRHRNDLILRDAAPPSGDSSTSTSELLTSNSATADTSRLYVTYDWINPTAILARDGTILERQSFSAFGQCRLLAGNWAERATSELSDWNFSFHGQFKDKETGWANYGYRLLLPVLGGWPGRDPLQEFAGPNIYLFALNSPLVFNDLLGLEIYFAIYFLNPVSDPPKSFEKAANTWLDQQRWFRGREKQFGKKTGCDEYLAKGVTTREDFIKAWNEILASSDALEKKCHGSGKIAKGAWFGHSGFNSKTDEPEINLSKSDISIADIKGFAKLPWKDKATMTLFSCRSGIAGAGMTLAGEFAKAQNVTTIGQKGYTYFSSDPAQDVPIKPDDKKIYLGAFVRRRNFWYSWGYFAGHVLAPTEFNP